MALIECYECGRDISSKAIACPHCAAPKDEPQGPVGNVDKKSNFVPSTEGSSATPKIQATESSKTERQAKRIPEVVNCAICLKSQKLNEDEQKLGVYYCPYCHSEAAVKISHAIDPTTVNKEVEKVRDSSPSHTSESIQAKQLAKLRTERTIDDLLEKKTKVSVLSVIAMFLFLWFIPTASMGGNPIGTLIGVFFSVLAFRCWIERRTYQRILLKKSTNDYFVSIYLPSLWSYFWRSLLTMIGIAIVIEVLAGGNWSKGYGYLTGTIIAFWIVGSIFVVDIPFWVKRKVVKIHEIN
jgi:DNA-directed RNA polymerase subunit RPC12/RpoP